MFVQSVKKKATDEALFRKKYNKLKKRSCVRLLKVLPNTFSSFPFKTLQYALPETTS